MNGCVCGTGIYWCAGQYIAARHDVWPMRTRFYYRKFSSRCISHFIYIFANNGATICYVWCINNKKKFHSNIQFVHLLWLIKRKNTTINNIINVEQTELWTKNIKNGIFEGNKQNVDECDTLTHSFIHILHNIYIKPSNLSVRLSIIKIKTVKPRNICFFQCFVWIIQKQGECEQRKNRKNCTQ